MAFLDWTVVPIQASAYCGQLAYDGTYIWFVSHTSTGNATRLYRMRLSDKALIKPDGTVGDAGNAYVALTSTVAKTYSLVTNGTVLMVGTHEWIQIFDCASMTNTGHVGTTSNTIGYGCTVAAWDGTHFWFTSMFPSDVVHKITPAGSASQVISGIGRNIGVRIANGHAWVFGSTTYQTTVMARKFALDGTLLLTVPTNLPTIPAGNINMAYDSARGEFVCTGTSLEFTKFRESDGAFIDFQGNVVATAGAAQLNSTLQPTKSLVTGTYGAYIIGNIMYVGGDGSNVGSYSLQRRNTNTGEPAGLWYKSLPHGVMDMIQVGNTLFLSLGGEQYWALSGIAWSDMSDQLPAPNLTAVTPGAGPHLSLTFDAQVGITGPTIGSPADRLGVTGVTAISTTQIDLACAIRPDHPDGSADNSTLVPPVGEADILGPPVPTGIGATVI